MSNFPISGFFPPARDVAPVRSPAARRPATDLIAPIEDPDDGLIDRYDPNNHEPPEDSPESDTSDNQPSNDQSQINESVPAPAAEIDLHGPRRAPSFQRSLFPTSMDHGQPPQLDISA